MVLLGLLALSACAGNQARWTVSKEQDSSRSAWVDSELAPYLRNQLSTHPRFRGQPLLLVGMSGDDVTPQIDALTSEMRAQLLDSLVQTPGVKLAWRPTARLPEHHRRLPTVDCDRDLDVAYFIGIETTREPTGRLRVAVRALDPHDGTWVSGFGKVWSGPVTAAEDRALSRRQPDPYLRGLRALPFDAGQRDLMAAYLARNLSCLMQDRDEPTLLHVAHEDNNPMFSNHTLELIGNYLAQYRDVRLSERRSEANLILSGEPHRIDGSMYQLWVSVQANGNNTAPDGIHTAAYVLTDRRTSSPLSRPAPQESVPPQIATLRTATFAGDASCGMLQGGGLTAVDSFRPRNRMRTRACLALEVDLQGSADLYLLRLDSDGRLQRVFPGTCRAGTVSSASREAGLHRWPLATEPAGVTARSTADHEAITYYALALPPLSNESPLARHLMSLEAECGPGAAGTGEGRRATAQWLTQLQPLLLRDGNRIGWRSLRLDGGEQTP